MIVGSHANDRNSHLFSFSERPMSAACLCRAWMFAVTEEGSPMTAVSSAYRMKLELITLDNLLSPPRPASLFVSWIRVCMTRLKRYGEIVHPCRMPCCWWWVSEGPLGSRTLKIGPFFYK